MPVSLLVLTWSGSILAQALPSEPLVLFEDRSEAAGLQWRQEKPLSVCWVDFDRDGLDDLYLQSHNDGNTRLYKNMGDGNFKDVIGEVMPDWSPSDTHGASWADYDNDGDMDLFIAVGAYSGRGRIGKPNFFYRNEDGVFTEAADELGVGYPLGRGRTGLWFDWNLDGLLDLFITNEPRADGNAPNVLYLQTPEHHFVEVESKAGLLTSKTHGLVLLSDIYTGDSPQLVLLESGGRNKNIIHNGFGIRPSLGQPDPFTEGRSSYINDIAIADFNRDLVPDLFLARAPAKIEGSDQALILSEDKRTAMLTLSPQLNSDGVSEIRFKSDGILTVDMASRIPKRWLSEIYIGATGFHPDAIPFELDPRVLSSAGLAQIDDSTQTHIYIGLDEDKQWVFRQTGGGGATKAFFLSTTEPMVGGITGKEKNKVQMEALEATSTRERALTRDLLLMSQDGVFNDLAVEASINRETYCGSVVAGDFDNDMDVDLFMVCGLRTSNLDNILYLNDGKGNFELVPGAGGATSGTYGPQFFEFGSGQRVAMSDYDRDGFLDIYVSSTHFTSATQAVMGVPPHLYRNLGNENHWFELDLEGRVSNRDGIGARVVVETQDGIRQVRERSGGMHQWSQNSARLHFGLGANTRVTVLTVTWPSGQEQVLRNVSADQLLLLKEPRVQPPLAEPEIP